MSILEIIPADRRDSVAAAFAGASGSARPEELRQVTGGASGALTYRVEVAGRPYFLRVEGGRTPLRNPHQYVCMQTAADAGIAPPLRYLDADAGVAVMDFVPQRPLAEYPGGQMALASDLGTLVSRLQKTPTFPELHAYPALLQRMLGYVRSSGMFAEGLLDAHAEGFEKIREAYHWDASGLVSSHNDPNPRNIIFDGERLWFIDWETSYRNDPLADLAILVDNFAPTPELEDALLVAWHGGSPDRVLRARLVLMRQLTRLYYAGIIFSVFAGAPRSAPDGDLTALTPAELAAAVEQGRMKAASPELLYALGKVSLGAFLDGLSAPGFDEALAVAGAA